MEQCVRSSDIINRLLKFSKPSKGQIQAVNINESLEGLVEMLEHQYSVRNIRIAKNYAPGLPRVRIDEKEIQEVIMNLLHNAADAMAEGGTVTVATSCSPREIRIAVSDTGCGISRENMQKLFTPFFTTKDKGTGLGLSVCYGLIKAHKGELKCESQLGRGTTFTIVLPIEWEG
jgi:two-component system NtrC family sensor kinase